MNAKKLYSFLTRFVFTKLGSEVHPDRAVAISLLRKLLGHPTEKFKLREFGAKISA